VLDRPEGVVEGAAVKTGGGSLVGFHLRHDKLLEADSAAQPSPRRGS
jgi:hypothetical protein